MELLDEEEELECRTDTMSGVLDPSRQTSLRLSVLLSGLEVTTEAILALLPCLGKMSDEIKRRTSSTPPLPELESSDQRD